MKRKDLKKIVKVLECAFVLTILLPNTVQAIDPLEVGSAVSLEINYQGVDAPVEGALFKIYKVAEMDRFAEFTLKDEFKDYPIILEDLDTNGWRAAAETFASYIVRDKIVPVDAGRTDQDGKLAFPAQASEMTTGLYLVMGEKYTYNYKIYYPEPVLVSLPNRDVDDNWQYDVIMEPKYATDVQTTELEVMKVWKGTNKTTIEEVEVQLLKGDTVEETVKLNKENSWRHKWTDLEAEYEWKVVEKKVPEGYTVSIEKEDGTYVITNTYKTTTTTTNIGGGGSKLQQTGMLWWPVPVLACLGMICFLAGWIRRQKSGE